MTQLIWGFVLFQANSLLYTELNKSTAYKHAFNDRVGRRSSNQFLGPGDDVITLPGKLAPIITGGRTSLQLLKIQAETGLPYPLIEGNGYAHGFYVLESIDETGKYHLDDGRPRIIDFTAKFKRVGDDKIDFSQLATSLTGLL